MEPINTKPWWAEREFVMTVGCVVSSLLLMFQGNVTEGVALLGGSTGAFSIGRGIAKAGGAIK